MHARDNPFRVDRVLQIRYRFASGDLASLLTRWMEFGKRGAIVGPEGSGKTTLLEDLVTPLRERGFLPRLFQVHGDDVSWPWNQSRSWGRKLAQQDVILLDGAEKLSSAAWWHFRWSNRFAAGILITTHQAGWLRTVWECSTSPALLFRIVSDLSPQSNLSEAVLFDLYRRHGGNLRDVLRELYDQHAARVKILDSSLAARAE